MARWTLGLVLLVLLGASAAGCTHRTTPATSAPHEAPATAPPVGADQPATATAAAPSSSQPPPTQDSATSAPPPEPDPAAAQQNSTAAPTATERFEPRLDVLLDNDYPVLPVEAPVLYEWTFDVEHPYQTLEVTGAYNTPVWAVDLQVSVKDPTGKQVIHYNSLDSQVLVTGTGGSADSFPIGYAYDVPLGKYTLSVTGAGAVSTVTLLVRGHLGMPFEFKFHNSVEKSDDKVSNYRGKVVLVDLMATWCTPCKEAMPGLKKIREDYDGKVEVLSIDVDDTESDGQIMTLRDQMGATWPFGRDDRGQASDQFGTGWIPSFGVLDQYGGLLFRHIGEMDTDDLRAIIDYALENR